MSKKRPGDTDFTDFTDYDVVISVVFSIGSARIQKEKSARIRVIRGIRVPSFVDGFCSFARGGCTGIAEAQDG
ncbi:MAG: hypothetical protein Q8M95_05395 [Candidatus Methanoperedens sp.]|nr:hypothetical protein [Candidatus Methanoperedens sp.]